MAPKTKAAPATAEAPSDVDPLLAALHKSTKKGDADAVKAVLNDLKAKHGAGHAAKLASAPLKDGATLLCIAADKGFDDVLQVLLEAGVDPNVRERKGDLPLLVSLSRDDDVSARVLLEHGADPAAVDGQKANALHVCARMGCRRLMEFLIHDWAVRTGAGGEKTGGAEVGGGSSAAEPAAASTEGVRRYLDVSKALLAKDAEGKTALHLACEEVNTGSGFLEIVSELLSTAQRVLPDTGALCAFVASTTTNGETVLHALEAFGDIEGASVGLLKQFVVKYGVDPAAKNTSGESALHNATARGNVAFLKAVVAAYGSGSEACTAAFSSKDGSENTLLHIACSENSSDALKYILSSKLLPSALFGAKNSDGNTAPDVALLGGHGDILSTLRQFGVITAKEHDEYTAKLEEQVEADEDDAAPAHRGDFRGSGSDGTTATKARGSDADDEGAEATRLKKAAVAAAAASHHKPQEGKRSFGTVCVGIILVMSIVIMPLSSVFAWFSPSPPPPPPMRPRDRK